MPYLPPRIDDSPILFTARIEHRVGVVEMYKNLVWNVQIRQQREGAALSAHRNVTDGTSQRRTGMCVTQLRIAPERTIHEYSVAKAVHGAKVVRDLRDGRRISQPLAVGLKQQSKAGLAWLARAEFAG